jgi:hypothetical protein
MISLFVTWLPFSSYVGPEVIIAEESAAERPAPLLTKNSLP